MRCVACRLTGSGDEQAVSAVTAPVDDAGDVLVSVMEEEEIVTEQLHLLDCFLNVHRFDIEALGANQITEVLVLLSLESLQQRDRFRGRERAADRCLARSVPALPLAVHATNLLLELVDGLIDRLFGVGGALLCPQHVAPAANGDLGGGGIRADPVVQLAQLELRVDDVVDQAVKPRRASIDERDEIVVDGNAIAANLDFHA